MSLHKKLLIIGLSIGVAAGAVSGAWSQTSVPSATTPAASSSTPAPWWKTDATTPAGNSTGPSQCPPRNGAGSTDICPNPGGGNPINFMSGNKYQREEDMPALPGVLGLEIVRHYNSFFSHPGNPNGIMGRGWKLSYETELHVTGRVLQLTYADGKRVIFNRDPLDSSLCAGADPGDGRIVIRKTARGDEYTLILPNGRKLDFNSRGKLTQILAPTKEFVSLQYDGRGMLQRVTDPQGRTLQLRYLDKGQAARGDRFTGVVAIDSPVGRFKYEYGSELPKGATLDKIHVVANLVKVSFPTHYDSKQKLHPYTDRGVTSSSIARIYHYEDSLHPTLLTGITVSGSGSDGKLINQRIGTYGYNANGLGILTVKGEPARYVTDKDGKPVQPPKLVEGTGVEQVTIDYREPGQTIIKNSLGQETVYKYANTPAGLQLLEVRGAGCASCGEPNMRYRYDRMGRVIEITKLTPAGQPIEMTKRGLDFYGRVLKASSVNYQRGKPGKEQWILRYEYQDDNPNPKLIARPSVVPGLEAHTRIVYGTTEATRYLPVQVTESGYVPKLDGKSAPQSISRIVRYSYNSEGQQIETDGPLVNAKENPGPDNSDITRTEYDPRIKLPNRTVAPGGITTQVIERDDALRPTVVRHSDGVRMVETRATYSYSGHIQTLTQNAGFIKNGQLDLQRGTLSRTTSYTYDAIGRLVSVKAPDGSSLRTEYNLAGLPVALLDPKGNRIAAKFDTEGRLLAVVTLDHESRILNGMLNLWDESGDLRAHLTPVGLDMATNQTPIPGQKIWMDANGGISAAAGHANRTELLSADQGTRSLVSARGGVALIDPAKRAHAILNDDFGRPVAEIAPDEGRLAYRYDDTVFHKRHTSLDGQRTVTETLEFAVSGRLTKRVRAGCTETMHYEGDLLARLDGCGNSHVFKRDAFGQIVQHTQIIQKEVAPNQTSNGKSSAWLTFTTEYSYDPANGRLTERTLPDGQHLRYSYDPMDGQPFAINRDHGWLAWIDHVVSPRLANGLRAILPQGFTDEPVLADISYAPFSDVNATTAGNRLRSENQFDAAGRMVAMKVGVKQSQVGTPSVESVSYDYDAAGNIVRTKRNGNVHSYRYDAGHRLTEQRFEETSTQPVGPKAKSTVVQTAASAPALATTSSIGYAYDPVGRRRDADAASVERDAYGRQTRHGRQRLIYDDTHRLVEVVQEGKTVARYRYDVLGNRVAKTVNGWTTYFLYDTAHKLVAEVDETGKTASQYLYAGHQPYAVMRAESYGQTRALYAIHADHRGLPLAITDEKQRVVWQSDFDAFGNERSPAKARVAANDYSFSLLTTAHAASDSSFVMPLRAAGQYADAETGLYYNIHRYYDPKRGRYITPDPMGLVDSDDAYTYVNGNPLRTSDPLGLFEIEKDFFWGVDNSKPLPVTDHGHSDILRIAFAQYAQKVQEVRFSQTIIDQIVRNNYHSDSQANPLFNPLGGQGNFNNHFDNPNNGPICQDESCTKLMPQYGGGKSDFIAQALAQLQRNRSKYTAADEGPLPTARINNISPILSSFGQNSHALADFYAHTNWVDSGDRGGYVCNYLGRLPASVKVIRPDRLYKNVPNSDSMDVYEVGYVPKGLGKTSIWDETVSGSLYSGTVNLTSEPVGCGLFAGFTKHGKPGDIVCETDKTTHGYWNKDDLTSPGGKADYTGPERYGWALETYEGTAPERKVVGGKSQVAAEFGVDWYGEFGQKHSDLKVGDRVYMRYKIKKEHELAFNLAVEHTINEIDRLYRDNAGNTIGGIAVTDIFKMDSTELKAKGVVWRYMGDKR